MTQPHVPLAERLADKRVVVCAGAGGVGKTTSAAALALGLARRGRKVAVVTIDPAKRLAAALGLTELEGEPRRIDADVLAAQGVVLSGELWALTLDVQGTFDGLIARLAPDERAREEVLSNRLYQQLSSAVAGSQEFTAVAKLYELSREHDFDVIVLDTPPSRNALDFLDAPGRLTSFFDGRALKVLLAPTGLATRFVGRGTGLVLGLFTRVTGVDLLGELSVFFGSLSGITDGFRERAHGVEALLRDERTSFVIVTSPEPEPAQEAIFLAGRLAATGMRRDALVVNRVHEGGLHGHTVEQVHALLAADLDEAFAGRLASNLGDFDVLVARDRTGVERLSSALEDRDPILVPHLDADIQDIAGLALIERHLFA